MPRQRSFMVEEEGMANNVLIQGKSPEKARLIRSLNPKVGIIARYRGEGDVEKYAPYHPEVMEVDPEVSDEVIRQIKAGGTRVQMKVGYLKDGDFEEKDWAKRMDRGVNIALSDFIPGMVRFLRRTAFNLGSEARPRDGSKGWKPNEKPQTGRSSGEKAIAALPPKTSG